MGVSQEEERQYLLILLGLKGAASIPTDDLKPPN